MAKKKKSVKTASHNADRKSGGKKYETKVVFSEWFPEFRPSKAQFANFHSYVTKVVEPECAAVGICKIIPPNGWWRKKPNYDSLEWTLAKPVSQHIAGKKGVFTVDLLEKKNMTLSHFKQVAAHLSTDQPDDECEPEEVERKFWRSLRPTMTPPIYGADIVGSLFEEDPASSWNLSKIDTILRKIDLPGVTRPMLYFGMWRAMFAFHTEDINLFSINYLHHGKPKFWYGIPPEFANRFQRAAEALFPEKHMFCHEFTRHKNSLISPSRLREFDIPYVKAFQNPGEFVITFPNTFHGGFNLGYNIAEAVNFATLGWIPKGLSAKVCKCRPDSVRIDMNIFIQQLFIKNKETTAPSNTKNKDKKKLKKRKDITDGMWILSCKCGDYISSDDADYSITEDWFECTECRVWAHLRCVHPQMLPTQAYPAVLLCHRCLASSKKCDTAVEATVPSKKRKPSAGKKSTSVAKAKKQCIDINIEAI